MAKVKGFKSPSRTEKMRCELEDAINKARTYCEMNEQEICLSLGMSKGTLFNRLKNPDSFTLGELRILAMLNGKDYASFLAKIVQ